MRLLAKFKKILYMGFRATLNFRRIKVALNPMYRIFLNFAKSCIYSCKRLDWFTSLENLILYGILFSLTVYTWHVLCYVFFFTKCAHQ